MADRMHKSAVLGWNLAMSAGAGAASWALVSPRFAASLVLGALVESVNFRTLWRHAEVILRAGSARVAALAAFLLRFLLLGAVLFVALHLGADPLGFLAGLSIIIPAVLLAAWQARPAVDPNAPSLAADDPAWDAWNPWAARENQPDDDEESS